ncbi:MAG: DUF2752 domain-containing protein [Planctomycetota bacterium]
MMIPRGLPTALFQLTIVIAVAVVLGLAVRIEPDSRGFGTHEQLGLQPCGYLQDTGRPCPSCGMTTAFSNTVRLRFGAAFRANPAGFLLCLVAMATPLYLAHARLTHRRASRIFDAPRLGWILVGGAAILAASWAYEISRHAG